MKQKIMKKEHRTGYKCTSKLLPWSYSPSRHNILLFFSLFLLLTTSVFLIAASPKHDYHVSVTQMQYNTSSKLFEVSIRIFTDDLELALSKSNQNKRFTIRNNDQNDTYVSAYLQKRFLLRNAQKGIQVLKYVGKEQEEDATWIYLEIPAPLPVSGLSLENSVLAEIFDDQVNMTNILLPSGKKTYLFKKGQLIYTL